MWACLARITLHAVAPAMGAGAILIFLTAFNELTVSALLWSSGTRTAGVMIFSLQYKGNSTGSSALSVLSLVCMMAVMLTVDLAGRNLPSATLPWRAKA